MDRYPTRIEDGVLYLGEGDPVEVGPFEDVIEEIGGEVYTISYENRYSHTVDWLDLDEDGEMSVDVRETILDMDFPTEFVAEIEARSPASNGGASERVEYFAEIMTTIWDSKGDLDDLEDNPFY